MSAAAFLRCELFDRLGIEHGFGTQHSDAEAVPDLAHAKQVHGTTLISVPPLAGQTPADALWTRDPGLAVGVFTADCVPVLLVEAERRAVCAVHAGWRGSAAGISELTAAGLARALSVDASGFLAAIGPHIGPCCYEVDRPVREAIDQPGVFSDAHRPGHYMLDLFELNRQQLMRAGLQEKNIVRVGGCTACEPEVYFSYRRDGSAGRMLHFVRMPVY